MMEEAKKDEVLDLRFTAVEPVLDVMGMEKGACRAAGESTAGVAHLEGAAYRRRDASRLATNIERRAGRASDGSLAGDERRHETRVAGDAAQRFRGNVRAVLERPPEMAVG